MIPKLRDALNATDDELSRAIYEVEEGLGRLQIGVPVEITYDTADGRFFLRFGKWDAKWRLVHGLDEDDAKETPLVSASRQARGIVFQPDPVSGFAPIEQLVIAVPDTLASIALERSPLLVVARRLVAVLESIRLE